MKTPREAAIDGSIEMFPAVLTATLTTVFAFLPLLILSGEMGMFMKVLPVMISILLVSSLFEAFYFLPLHSKELFSMKDTKIDHDRSNFWVRLDVKYEKLLQTLLKRKKRSLFLLVLFIVLSTAGMLGLTKFKLFPDFDTTQIYLNGKVDVNYKLEDTEEVVSDLEKKLLDYYKKAEGLGEDEVSSITSVSGLLFNADQSFESGSNLFHIFINL